MKNISVLLLAIILLSTGCRIDQPGIVELHNERGENLAFAGVKVDYEGTSGAKSDANGKFVLRFPKSSLGEKAVCHSITKDGYVVFNTDELMERTVNPEEPLVIVVCRADWFDNLCAKYRNHAEKTIRNHLQEDTEDCRYHLRGKQEELYLRLRAALGIVYRSLYSNLDDLVLSYARVDVSKLCDEEQTIVKLVRKGKLNEAVAAYKDMKLQDVLFEKIRERDSISGSEKHRRAALQAEVDSVYEMLERQMVVMQLDGSLVHLEQCSGIRMNIADADHSNTLWLINTAKFAFDYMGDYEKALQYYNLALKNEESANKQHSKKVADIYSNMGCIYDAVENYDKSLECHKKSLEIMEKIVEPNHYLIASGYNNVGACYIELDDGENALKYLGNAYSIAKKSVVGDDGLFLTICNNLATLFYGMGYRNIPVKYLGEALGWIEAHPEITYSQKVMTYSNVAYVYEQQNDDAKALKYYMDALEVTERAMGDDSSDFAVILLKIAEIYEKTGDSDNAKKNYEQALVVFEETLPAGDTNIREARKGISRLRRAAISRVQT